MLAIFEILYLILLLFCIIAALFIAYHIVKYSLSKSGMILTLAIFVSVFSVLLFTNVTLFSALRWDKIFSFLLP